MGVLLGMSASRLGTCDEPTYKSLTVHIPTLLPSMYDLDLPNNVATCSLFAVGLLFICNGNRGFSEIALGLIGRKPLSDKVNDREGSSLAAGVALGLINLGRGSPWKRELQVEERLVRFVQGGNVMPPPSSSLSYNVHQSEGQISSIKEGNMVNIHVTAPAGIMALLLLNLQTNNQQICEQLSIPSTFSQLE